MKNKVLFIPRITDRLYFGGLNLGGVESYICNVAKLMLDNNWDVHCIFTDDSINFEGENKVTEIRINAVSKNKHIPGIAASDKTVIKKLRELDLSQYTFIFNHHFDPTIIDILGGCNVPSITLFHGTPPETKPETILKCVQYTSTNPNFHVAANSTKNYEMFIEYIGYLELLPIKIPDEIVDLGGYKDNIKKIIGVERVVKEKRPEIMVQMSKLMPEFEFTIYDSMRRDEKYLKKNFGNYDFNMHFHEPIDHSELRAELLTNSTIYCNRSSHESFGISCAESLMLGSPILVIEGKFSNSANFVKNSCLHQAINVGDTFMGIYETGILVSGKLSKDVITELKQIINWCNKEKFFDKKVIRQHYLDNYKMDERYIVDIIKIIE